MVSLRSLNKMFKNDVELLLALQEVTGILAEDMEKFLSGERKRVRVISACLRVLAADTHEYSTKGLLRFFADKYKFEENVIGNEDFENYIDGNILFSDGEDASFISRRQMILFSAQNDGLAHESKGRYRDLRKEDNHLASYRLWLDMSGENHGEFLCQISSELLDYSNRLIKFLASKDLSDKGLISL